MKNLKDKILKVLTKKNYSYSELAAHVFLTEAELDLVLENNTIEIRTLENISKELRIPLYSFFRKKIENFELEKESYYNVNIWGEDDENKPNLDLMVLHKENKELREEIFNKNLLISELEAKIKKK